MAPRARKLMQVFLPEQNTALFGQEIRQLKLAQVFRQVAGK